MMLTDEVELREVRAFLVLAEELHFGRTAERLGLTPSRVSQTIRTLETRVGARLFDRTSRQVRLSPVGAQLRRTVQPACEQLTRALSDARALAAGVAGTLRLGMYSPGNGGPHLIEMIKTFEARHPGCKVVVVDTGFKRDQLEWLRHGGLDLLAMRLPLASAEVTIGPILAREERIVAVAADHPLTAYESIAYEDLADYSVSDVPTLPREMMDAFIPPCTPSGQRLRRVALTRGVDEPLVRVALGEMVHPTVRSYVSHYRYPGVTFVPIRDLPLSETALVWLTAKRSANIDAFARAARDVLARRGTGEAGLDGGHPGD
jgi:DNA-binding transcriptional LysR family regulator